MENSEKIIFSNSFGTVSDKKVIVNYKNGTEFLPLKQITSVTFERNQNLFLASIYFIFGICILVFLFDLPKYSGMMFIVALLLFLFCTLIAIAYYIGNHQIKISVAGQDRKPIIVEMAKKKNRVKNFQMQ